MLVAWRGEQQNQPVDSPIREEPLLLPLIQLIAPPKQVAVRDPVGATAG
jgi:hypothetical protein